MVIFLVVDEMIAMGENEEKKIVKSRDTNTEDTMTHYQLPVEKNFYCSFIN